MPAQSPLPVLPKYYYDESHRQWFVKNLFDTTAHHYDRVERMTALGSGSRYRRQALRRAGLTAGMQVLDVAAGTGLIAREAAALTGDPGNVIALDPSAEMLHHSHMARTMPAVRAIGERLPCRANAFDFLSMGYALRHLSDLGAAFGEFFRVVKPGGRICLLEITRPGNKLMRLLLKVYMRQLVPLGARLITGQVAPSLLMRFYWDTIEACASPAEILEALGNAGFEHSHCRTKFGIFSEYTARKPD